MPMSEPIPAIHQSSVRSIAATRASVAPSAGLGSAVVKGAGANVRSAPSLANSNVLFVLAAGTRLRVLEDHRGWLRITDTRGRGGWIYEDFVAMRG